MDPVIAGHPLHPSLIPVPVGLLPASYVLDILAIATGNDSLAEASYYNMALGCAGAIPAALTGFLDYRQMEQDDPAHKTASTHGLMNGAIMGLYGLNLLVRRNNKRSKFGFLLSTIGTVALGVSGYLGGEIAYGRGWRVRSAERFELEWQKEHGTGPFAPKDAKPMSMEEKYPPQTIKGFQEKKSGEAVMKEIEQSDQAKSSSKPAKASPPSKPAGSITQPAGDSGRSVPERPAPDDKPSQAEGDRETIEKDLKGKSKP